MEKQILFNICVIVVKNIEYILFYNKFSNEIISFSCSWMQRKL